MRLVRKIGRYGIIGLSDVNNAGTDDTLVWYVRREWVRFCDSEIVAKQVKE